MFVFPMIHSISAFCFPNFSFEYVWMFRVERWMLNVRFSRPVWYFSFQLSKFLL
jgi:hypothetical protein